MKLVDGCTVPIIVKTDSHMFSDTGGNHGKYSGTGSSKGSPHTSHVDSKEISISSKGTASKDSSMSSSVKPTKPKNPPKPKDAPSSKDGIKARDEKT